MAIKNLKIDQLKLDQQNPRTGKVSDQHEAIQAVITEQGTKLANLAESIVENGGLNPMDRFLVMQDIDGKYIVLEGNRRTLALKLLINPAALTGLKVPSAVQKRFESLARQFKRETVEPISAWVAEDRTDGATWLAMRHIGEDDGRGIVRWSTEAKARWKGGNPALQALDFIRNHGNLTEDEATALEGIPLSTLDRLLSTPTVRTKIGFEVKDNVLQTALPVEEAIKPLKRIALDLTIGRHGKKIVVTDLKKVTQQTDYIRNLGATHMPDLAKADKEMRPIEQIDEVLTPRPAIAARQPGARKVAERVLLVRRNCKLNVTVNKMTEVFDELSSLNLKRHPNAIAVLLRVFMELSVDHYLTSHRLGLKRTDNGRERFKSLKEKLREAVSHMVGAGADRAELVDIERAISKNNHPLSIDLQHAYVHNRFMAPSDRELMVAWDNAQPFFERIWP